MGLKMNSKQFWMVFAVAFALTTVVGSFFDKSVATLAFIAITIATIVISIGLIAKGGIDRRDFLAILLMAGMVYATYWLLGTYIGFQVPQAFQSIFGLN